MNKTHKILMGTLIGAWALFVAMEGAGGATGSPKKGGLHFVAVAVRALRSILMFVLIVSNAILLLNSMQKKPVEPRF